jgi:bifunctional DNase/RNase
MEKKIKVQIVVIEKIIRLKTDSKTDSKWILIEPPKNKAPVLLSIIKGEGSDSLCFYEAITRYLRNKGHVIESVCIKKVFRGRLVAFIHFFKRGLIEDLEVYASEAIAIGTKENVPIYITQDILKRFNRRKFKDDICEIVICDKYSDKSLSELKEMLKEAIKKEYYEKSDEIKEEINRRESGQDKEKLY